jgi:hypothetical protein
MLARRAWDYGMAVAYLGNTDSMKSSRQTINARSADAIDQTRPRKSRPERGIVIQRGAFNQIGDDRICDGDFSPLFSP